MCYVKVFIIGIFTWSSVAVSLSNWIRSCTYFFKPQIEAIAFKLTLLKVSKTMIFLYFDYLHRTEKWTWVHSFHFGKLAEFHVTSHCEMRFPYAIVIKDSEDDWLYFWLLDMNIGKKLLCGFEKMQIRRKNCELQYNALAHAFLGESVPVE